MVDPRQKKLLTEIMEADAKDGLYDNHKLTAVEWFYQRILAEDIKSVFEQAKEMEKEQITDAYFMGANHISNRKYIGMHEYYNETYNK